MSVEEFAALMGVQPQAPAPQMPMVNQRPTMANDPRMMQAPAPQMPMAQPMPAPMMQQPIPAYQPPMTPVMEGQNANIGEDTRARAMAWLAQQGLR